MIVSDRTTAVLGGLIEDREVESQVGIPGLMNLPIIGYIFRKTKTQTKKTELIVTVTPYILHDDESLKKISQERLERASKKIKNKLIGYEKDSNVNKPSMFDGIKDRRKKRTESAVD